MNDVGDWKRQYFDALREAETEAARWRATEQALRWVVSRLCAVGMGADPDLDTKLGELAEAARTGTDAGALKTLAGSLSDIVLSIDSRARSESTGVTVAPSPTGAVAAAAGRWEAACSVTHRLLDALAAADASADAVTALRGALDAALEDQALAAVLNGVADLMAERVAAITVERQEAASMLAQVTSRLTEMAQYLAGSSAERRIDHDAADNLNVQILAQVEQLGGEARSTTDLRSLQTLVSTRLDSVAANLREFRAREALRFQDQQDRSERMRARISQLENETRSLSSNLDLERRRARTDPLTRIANRGSFDERIVAELARWQRFRTPVSLLLWDIDHFKLVNDQHGHRAGDGLLRAVADCLRSGRRDVDLVARFGGEEFVMLLVGTSLTDALKVANQTRERIAALKVHFRGTPVPVTISCGLTELRDGDTVSRVFDRADAALYRAKEQGRNRCIADPG